MNYLKITNKQCHLVFNRDIGIPLSQHRIFREVKNKLHGTFSNLVFLNHFFPLSGRLVAWLKILLGDFNLNVTYFGSASIEREGKFLGHLQVVTLKFLNESKPALTLKVFPCVVIQEQGLRSIWFDTGQQGPCGFG
jgi:hypothetical protein